MKKLVVEMKVIAYGMVHHMTKAFSYLQVFLSAVMTIMTFQNSSAIKTIIFYTVMFLHKYDKVFTRV